VDAALSPVGIVVLALHWQLPNHRQANEKQVACLMAHSQ
jgi:hypothetical protein